MRGVGSSNLPVPTISFPNVSEVPRIKRSGFRLRTPSLAGARLHARKTAQLGVRGVGSSNMPVPTNSFPHCIRGPSHKTLGISPADSQPRWRSASRPQNGSTWGARGRQFKSARPDHLFLPTVSEVPRRSALGISPADSQPRWRSPFTPAKRLNLGCGGVGGFEICPSRPNYFPHCIRGPSHKTLGISPAGSRFAHARKTARTWGARGRQFKSARPDHLFPPLYPRSLAECARDFACGLPASLALGFTPENGSTWGARGSAVQICPSQPILSPTVSKVPRIKRSGFRQRALASLTPAKRLNLGCEGSAVQICPSRPFLPFELSGRSQ